MTAAAFVVSICALAFTVISFWWLNARTGRLRSFAPQTFSGSNTPDRAIILLPLVLQNTGAQSIVVQDLRLAVLGEPKLEPLRWARTRRQLRPRSDEEPDFASVFSVPGHQAHQLFAEFDARHELGKIDRAVRLEAKTGHRRRWVELATFTLHLSAIVHPSQFITYANTPPSE
ncbi:hypothetical protein OHS58_36565 [Amycolatopsis sp. NBC_00348]|uniref:hypothetical protein n=1 Tax=Amycolatopsis sp. NBC_00348 TaxID=2975956 RepID=UPI002E26A0C1